MKSVYLCNAIITHKLLLQWKIKSGILNIMLKGVRHGPFEIQGGGGGAWVFGPSQNIFFGQNRSKIIFFAGPSGRIIFFITENYLHSI